MKLPKSDNNMKIKELEDRVKNGELSQEEINNLRNELYPHEWSYIRGLYNDYRIADIQEKIFQITAELELLYGNHISSIAKNMKAIEGALNKMGYKLDLSITHKDAK